MKISGKRKAFIAVLSVFAVSASGLAVASGCSSVNGRIDAPERIEADLGTYVIPDYDVVDKNGMILAGYNVYLKSATSADGEALDVSYQSVTVTDAGIYEFVYSAGKRNVSDVTVVIDFADRTAPTISYDERNLPSFFIKGNSYKMPAYTISGDFVREKCWAKVFHIAPDNTETEVEIRNTRFLVEHGEGSYAIRIHVEDAVGNPNDYEYRRKVDAPEKLVKDRVLYFNEEFGARQVSCHESSYKGGFTSQIPANVPDGNTEGGYKIEFDGVTPTENNEAYISVDVPALLDITDYEQLEMWVYYEGNNNIVMGSNWWNDTSIEKGKWVKMVWSTRVWGEYPAGASGSMDVTNNKFVGVNDITSMSIRVIFNYNQSVIPNGRLYFSYMNAVPKTPATVEARENVILDTDKFFKGDTINLSAKKQEGKTVDCYLLNGKPLAGNSFVITEDANIVEVKYVDGDITADNMTWATPEYVAPVGGDAQVHKLGEGKSWVLTYDVYNMSAEWSYIAAYVGGNDQLLGFELDGNSGKFAGYGGNWKWGGGVALSGEVIAAFRAATEAKPVTVKYIRTDSTVKAFVEYDGKEYFIASVDVSADLQVASGNSYGLGARKPVTQNNKTLTNGSVKNIRTVATSAKTELVHAAYAATVTKGDELIDFAVRDYRIGDKVKLSAPKQNGDKLFLCYSVNDKSISGDTFVISEKAVTVKAVYVDACVITLGEGLYIDGKTGTVTVPVGTVVTIAYKGTSPEGQYFAGIFVDGKLHEDVAFATTETAHSITVKYEDRIENDNEKLNRIDKAGDESGLAYHPTQGGWKPSAIEHVTDFGYEGADKTVDAHNSLKVTLSGSEQAFALTNGAENLDKYKELYFYVYSEKGGIAVGGWWCRDVATVAGKWVKVSFGRDKAPQNIDERSVWEKGLNSFVYSFYGAQSGDVVYVTSVYGVSYDDVAVTKEQSSERYLELSAPKYGTAYKQNETVTLTCNGAPANKAFVCFTVNGEDIEGNTYTLTEGGAEFGIRFADTSTLTFVDGASAVDGGTVFGKGATVKLTHEVKSGKFFDYYLIDGTTKLFTDEFKTSEATHTVKAVYAASADALTWEEYGYVAPSGNDAQSHKIGSSTHWAMTFDVSIPATGWDYVGVYIGGGDQLLGIELINNDGKFGGYGGKFNGMADGYNTPGEVMAALRSSSFVKTTMIYARSGDKLCVYVKQNNNLYEVGQVNFSTYQVTGDNFGIGGRKGPNSATQSNIEYIVGADKVNAYIQNTVAVKLEGAVNGQLVKYIDTEYTLPDVKSTVNDLFGNAVQKQVTVSVKDAQGNNVPVNDGKINVPAYTGSQALILTYSAEGALSASYKLILQKADTGILLEASALGAANVNANGNTVEYSTEQKHGSEAGSIKISNIVSNETGVFLAKSEYSRYIEFYAYTADSGVEMGGWWCNDTTLAQNAWTRVVIDTQAAGYDRHGDEIVLRLKGSCQGKTVYISSVRTIEANEAA